MADGIVAHHYQYREQAAPIIYFQVFEEDPLERIRTEAGICVESVLREQAGGRAALFFFFVTKGEVKIKYFVVGRRKVFSSECRIKVRV